MPIITVPIELDKPRNMAFTLRAMKALSARQIPDSTESLEALGANDLDGFVFMLHALLSHEDPKLTVEQLEGMLDLGNLPMVSQKISELFAKYEKVNPGFLARMESVAKTATPPKKSIGRGSKHTVDTTSASLQASSGA